jgi:hypothetical protein
VIRCLDVDRGRVVKGTNFVNLRDAGDPVEVAARYEKEGADELVFLDITASSEDRETIYDVVAATAEQVFIPLTVGGGVRSVNPPRVLLWLPRPRPGRRVPRAPRGGPLRSSPTVRKATRCRWSSRSATTTTMTATMSGEPLVVLA